MMLSLLPPGSPLRSSSILLARLCHLIMFGFSLRSMLYRASKGPSCQKLSLRRCWGILGSISWLFRHWSGNISLWPSSTTSNSRLTRSNSKIKNPKALSCSIKASSSISLTETSKNWASCNKSSYSPYSSPLSKMPWKTESLKFL